MCVCVCVCLHAKTCLWSSVVVEMWVEVKGAEERLPSFLICERMMNNTLTLTLSQTHDTLHKLYITFSFIMRWFYDLIRRKPLPLQSQVIERRLYMYTHRHRVV